MQPGPIYTRGKTYRARAEARQREFRANTLGVQHGKFGHMLDDAAAAAGSNFVCEDAELSARERQANGKGVAQRTFDNMLSSQAMCFNIFAPLAKRLDLAAEVLHPFVEGLIEVHEIHIEHTPSNDIFGDQTGRGGVDCDLLIRGRTEAGPLLQIVETKFVEPEFSSCGFRKPGRVKKGLEICPNDVGVGQDRDACLYQRKKGYRYWHRTDEFRVLSENASVFENGCPFAGQQWQLWVNLALAHAEAAGDETTDVRLSVCAAAANLRLLKGGAVLDAFRANLRWPASVNLMELDALLARIEKVAPADLADWSTALTARYRNI